ncbi:MAG: sugar MFS transporter [Bacteroidota bacterium]|nr:sugar MFS transporter [Bacteroidota bacterium]
MKKKNTAILPILIIGVLFFILGFITWLNGLLIPYLKTACELSDFYALFVTFAFYFSYTVMALPSSWILKKIGFKGGISVSLWVMAAGALVFIPAAYARTYSVFLVGLFILGTGMAILQTAINPYITILGPIESAAKRISIMGIANKTAGAIAPLVLAFFIVKESDELMVDNLVNMLPADKELFLNELAERVINPYIVMAIVLFVSGIVIRYSNLPDIKAEHIENQDKENNSNEDIKPKNIFSFPFLILGAVTLFFYVGAEVIAGDTIIQYGRSLDIPLEISKNFTSYTMAGMLTGYLSGIIFIPKYISQQVALKLSAILGLVFTVAALFTSGFVSVLFIALLGIANALVWPAVWPLAINGLGKYTKSGSAILVMAISGGAALPLVWGKFSDVFNSQIAYMTLIPAYLFILFFSVKGYKIKNWRKVDHAEK